MKEKNQKSESNEEPEIYSLKKGDSVWKPARRDVMTGAASLSSAAAILSANDEQEVSEGIVPPSGEGHSQEVTSLALCGDTLYSGGIDGQILAWDLEAGKVTRKISTDDHWAWQELTSGDGRLIGVSGYPPVASIWKKDSTGLISTSDKIDIPTPEYDGFFQVSETGFGYFLEHSGKATRVNISEKLTKAEDWCDFLSITDRVLGLDIANGFDEESLCLVLNKWLISHKTSRPIITLRSSPIEVEGESIKIASIVLPDKTILIAIAEPETGALKIVKDGSTIQKVVPRKDRQISSVATSLSTVVEGWIALGYDDGLVLLLDLEGNNLIGAFQAHAGDVTAIVSVENGETLASGGADRAVRIWDLNKIENHDEFVADHAPDDTYDTSHLDLKFSFAIMVRLRHNLTIKNWTRPIAPQSMARIPERPSITRPDLPPVEPLPVQNGTGFSVVPRPVRPHRPPTSSPSRPTASPYGSVPRTSRHTYSYHYWRPN